MGRRIGTVYSISFCISPDVHNEKKKLRSMASPQIHQLYTYCHIIQLQQVQFISTNFNRRVTFTSDTVSLNSLFRQWRVNKHD